MGPSKELKFNEPKMTIIINAVATRVNEKELILYVDK